MKDNRHNIKIEQVFQQLKEKLWQIAKDHNLLECQVRVTSGTLAPEEAIGITERKDFPILSGKEVMLQAVYQNGTGQAFTDCPAVFEGSLEEVLELDLVEDAYARGLFIGTLNAVLNHLGMAEHTVHCKNKEPELCAEEFVSYILEHYNHPKIVLIGYQPALIEHLSKKFELRVLDLNPETVGQIKYGIKVEDGVRDYKNAVLEWGELILCTGSTICNGTIVQFMNLEKEVLFFGTTLAGAAELLGLKRICYNSK